MIHGGLARATAAEAPPPRQGAGPLSLAPARHGEGIGLSIVKRLCQSLDATLTMDSAPALETSFTILLPRRYPSEPASGTPAGR